MPRSEHPPTLERVRRDDAKVAELVDAGATVVHHTRNDNPGDPIYYVVMRDPEGNEFCVG